MATYLVWILLTVSNGPYNYGTVGPPIYFKDVKNCESVKKQLSSTVISMCVQAEVMLPK